MSPATLHAAYLQAKAGTCAAPWVQLQEAVPPAASATASQPHASSTPNVPLNLELDNGTSDDEAPMDFGSPGQHSFSGT